MWGETFLLLPLSQLQVSLIVNTHSSTRLPIWRHRKSPSHSSSAGCLLTVCTAEHDPSKRIVAWREGGRGRRTDWKSERGEKSWSSIVCLTLLISQPPHPHLSHPPTNSRRPTTCFRLGISLALGRFLDVFYGSQRVSFSPLQTTPSWFLSAGNTIC